MFKRAILSLLVVFSCFALFAENVDLKFFQRWEKQLILDKFGDPTKEYMYVLNGQSGTYTSSANTVKNEHLDWALFLCRTGETYLLLLENGEERSLTSADSPDERYILDIKTDDGSIVSLNAVLIRNQQYYNAVEIDGNLRKIICSNKSIKMILSNKKATYNLGSIISENFINALGVYRGPSGGWVFYDKGYYSDGWRYIEAAPTDLPGLYPWGNTTEYTSAYIGNGHYNTALISDSDTDGATTAAAACKAYSVAGNDSWALPTKDELAMMHEKLAMNGIGHFDLTGFSSAHWSSTAGKGDTAWYIYFSDGSLNTTNCSDYLAVRPIRAF